VHLVGSVSYLLCHNAQDKQRKILWIIRTMEVNVCVCPVSNVRLSVCPSRTNWKVKKMGGLRMTWCDVTHLHNHCCHENTTVRLLCPVVQLQNISCSVNIMNLLRHSCKVPDIVWFQPYLEFPEQNFLSVPSRLSDFTNIFSVLPDLIQSDRRTWQSY
jgi:hypothetical protein